jgi:hypothetical protein
VTSKDTGITDPAYRFRDLVPEGWAPDVRTLEWALGVIDSEDIAEMIKADLRNRAGPGSVLPGDDEFWGYVGESAVESVLWPVTRAAQMIATGKRDQREQ